MTKRLGWTLFFGLLFVSNTAFAADAVTQTWWQLALNNIIEIAVAVLTPSLITIINTCAKVLADKAGIHLAESQYNLLDDLVTKGVAYAQEQGHKALKNGVPLTPEDKRAHAVQFVTNGITHLGLTGVAQQLVEQYVEAKLNTQRNAPTTTTTTTSTTSIVPPPPSAEVPAP